MPYRIPVHSYLELFDFKLMIEEFENSLCLISEWDGELRCTFQWYILEAEVVNAYLYYPHSRKFIGTSLHLTEDCLHCVVILYFKHNMNLAGSDAEEGVKMASVVDEINAYSYLYPVELPSKKYVFKW